MKLAIRILNTFVIITGLIAGAGRTVAVALPDEVTSRSVTAKSAGATDEVVLNQTDTSAYPNVTIFATVLKNGTPVDGLTASDFRVREDEVDQEPLTVIAKLAPLSTVIVVDTSGSIKKSLPDIQQAASAFIDTLGSDDRFTVISFAREVKILSTSGDRAGAKAAVMNTTARGDTALYDAVYESLQNLKDQKGRKAVVLLTDGVDDDGHGKQLSKHSVEDGLGLAKLVNAPIFTV